MEIVIPLEAKTEKSKTEEDLLAMNRKLISVTKENEQAATVAISAVLVAGLLLSLYGATKWHQIVQKRDDQLAELQLRKLAAEVARLEAHGEKDKAPNDG